MKTLRRFWSGLEAISGLAAVTVEWQEVWGCDWDLGQAFLRPTDQLVSSYPCPRPGGDGCPRKVVMHSEQDIVAVCQAVPKQCDDLTLTKADIVAYELHWQKLATALSKALGLTAVRGRIELMPQTRHIAWHHLVGGKRAAVYLTIQHDGQVFGATLSRLLAEANVPFILASPTADLCQSDSAGMLRRAGVLFLPLDECLAWEEGRGFAATDRAEALLSDLAAAAPRALTQTPGGSGGRLVTPIDVPRDARWGELYLVIGDERLAYRLREKRDEFGYAEAGFENRRSRGNPPDQLWELLHRFARGNGSLRREALTPDKKANLKQQVSALGRRLRALFPIPGRPFTKPTDAPYRASFHIRPKDGMTIQVPNGCTWPRVAIVETRGGSIRFVLEGTKRFMAYDDGQRRESSRVAAERPASVTIEHNLEELDLLGDDGAPTPAGQALLDVLRARRRVKRDRDDRGINELCHRLCRITQIEESPFEFDFGRGEWVPVFAASSEVHGR